MKTVLGCLAVLPLSVALVVACGSSDDAPPDDGSSSGSSGGLAEAGSSGASGSSGTSGTSGTSGNDGSTPTDGAVVVPLTKCDPAMNTCKAGEVCTNVGPAPQAYCRPGCKNDGECTGTPKSGCVIVQTGMPPGACIPTCKPYSADCAAGTTCTRVPEVSGVTQTSKAAFCRKTGATPINGNCVNDPGACGPNAECLFFPEPPQNEGVDDSKCHTLCDPAHPCGAGKGNCFTKAGDSFGFCNQG